MLSRDNCVKDLQERIASLESIVDKLSEVPMTDKYLLTKEEILIKLGYIKDSLDGWWECPDGYTRQQESIDIKKEILLSQAQIDKLIDKGWKSPEELELGIHKAALHFRKLCNVEVQQARQDERQKWFETFELKCKGYSQLLTLTLKDYLSWKIESLGKESLKDWERESLDSLK